MLTPKNHKDYIDPTAEELDVSPFLVEDCVSFFYSKVRKSIASVSHMNIHVSGLGTFKVKRKELVKLQKKYENHLNLLNNPENFNQMKTKKEIEHKYQQVLRISDMMDEEYQRKEQIKKQRKRNKRYILYHKLGI